jgi:hypothetical protein
LQTSHKGKKLTKTNDSSRGASPSQLAAYDEITVTSSVQNKSSILLVYPFVGGEQIALAATNLHLCNYQAQYFTEDLTTLQLDHTAERAHAMTFCQIDLDSLNQKHT